MKVFLSWSGNDSNKLATIFKEWLPNVLQYTKPYLSSEDNSAGTRWSPNIAKELNETSYGVIFVTKNNVNAPWINFEAGALSKQFDSSYVTPFLYKIKTEEIKGPLIQFQTVGNTKEGILSLVRSINTAANESKLDELRLTKIFDVWWPLLDEKIKAIKDEEIEVSSEENLGNANNSVLLENTEAQIGEILNLVRNQQKQIKIISSKNREPSESADYLLVHPGAYQDLEESMSIINGVITELDIGILDLETSLDEVSARLEMALALGNKATKYIRMKNNL